jgi:hypothetical protein
LSRDENPHNTEGELPTSPTQLPERCIATTRAAQHVPYGMFIPRILGAACVVAYFLAMWLPAVATKGYDTTYLLDGWEVTYVCGLFSFAPSLDLGDRAPFILGTLSNLLFLFCITLFLIRLFWGRSWPHYMVICWISGVCVVFAAVSISIAGMWLGSLLVGSYLWILSLILLFLGSLDRCWQRPKVTDLG